MDEALSLAANRRLFLALLLNFVLFGTTVTIIGAAVPKVIREFGWSYLVTGIVISAASVGYFVSSFLSGLLIQRLGSKKVILLGLLIQASGLASFGAVRSVLANLLASTLIGLGEGGTEVVTNFCVARMETPGQSRLMNLMHAAFPVGSILGPVLIGWLMHIGRSWQEMFRAMAVATIGACAGLSLFSFENMHVQTNGHEKAKGQGLLRRPLLFLLFLTIFLYVGSEIGISSWIAEYYVKVFGTSPSVGAYMVSVFWLGILAGRLLVSIGYRGYRQAELLLFMCLLSVTSLAVALCIGSAFSAGAAFLLCGTGCSGIYPIVMALTGEHFRDRQSLAIGIVSTGGGVGSFSFPFAMAAIANSYGIRVGLFFYIATMLGMSGFATGVLFLVRRAKIRGD